MQAKCLATTCERLPLKALRARLSADSASATESCPSPSVSMEISGARGVHKGRQNLYDLCREQPSAYQAYQRLPWKGDVAANEHQAF